MGATSSADSSEIGGERLLGVFGRLVRSGSPALDFVVGEKTSRVGRDRARGARNKRHCDVKRVEELLKLKSTDVQAVAATDDGGTTVVEGGLTIRIRTGKKIIKESTNVANYKREAAQILPHQQQRRRLGVLMVKAHLIQSIQHPQESCESLRLIFSARKSQLRPKS